MATNTDFQQLHHKNSTDTTGAVVLKYWPIIVALAVTLTSLGGIFVKLDYIQKAIERNDLQYSQVINQQNITGQGMVEIRGKLDGLQGDNVRNQQQITELRGKLEALSDKARWSPR